MSGRRLVARSKWETEAGRDESCLEMTQPRDWTRGSQINQSGMLSSVCRDQRDGARPEASVPPCLPSPLLSSITAARKKKKKKREKNEKGTLFRRKSIKKESLLLLK